MQQPVPPQQELPPQNTLTVTAAPVPAANKKNAKEDSLFIDHWLLLFNQQEDEDNENSHVPYELKSA
jgi:hypothetical protein